MVKKIYFLKLKSIARICLMTAGIFTFSLSAAQDVTTGLKMYYNFEGFSGTTLPDASGNALDGTIMGNATLKTGFSGLGLFCQTKNDYIFLKPNLTANFQSFTFATWAYFNTVNGATRFFDLGNIAEDNNPDDFFAFMPNSGSGYARMRYRSTGGATGINVDATVVTPAAKWTHFAITFNWDEASASGTATIYINGAPAGTSTFSNINLALLDAGVTANNYIGRSRWAQDGNGLNAILDEIRLYNRALTESDIAALYAISSKDLMLQNGYTEALMNAQENLSIPGDLSAVTAPLALPSTADGGVTIKWASSNNNVVDSLGNINRPAQYDMTVKLTATLSQTVNGKIYNLTKDFTVVVKAFNEVGYQLAKWTFASEDITLDNGVIKVKDESESQFTGTVMNDASIRTIGSTDKFNVLDLGNGTGYFDMGTDIGKAIYSLNNYTMCGYFRIDDDYTDLNSNGNFYWTFSNTDSAMTKATGYIVGVLKSQSHNVATGNYTDDQNLGLWTTAPQGAWHHMAYTQSGQIGTFYIDGIPVDTATITLLPSLALPRTGMSGTKYNWLGRSNYVSDVYLRKTLLYDFELWRDAVSADDLNYEMNVADVINKLNNAYNENPNALLPELTTEKDALTINNIDAITGNINMPLKGSKDQTVSISWQSNQTGIINVNGNVTRPDYFPRKVTLTATLSKNGQKVTKTFNTTVLAKAGSAFTSNLLVKHNFANVSGTVVTDAAEKHFQGELVNGADIRTIGEVSKFNTLDLTDSTGYFNLGPEVGKILYSLNDYTMSCYYRVDSANTKIGNAGNFLWTFSNSDSTGTYQTGCLFCGLRSQTMAITPQYWKYGEQTVSVGTAALTGSWHHMAYTQKDTTGSLYVDGMLVASDTVAWLPSNTLLRDNSLGTKFNWLGRSCYVGDAYLTKALLYDFRIYNKALTEEEIQTTELNVGANINALEAAYAENPNIPASIKTAESNSVRIYSTSNGIRINGLTGKEKVTLFDITGRQVQITNPSDITISRGIYLVNVNNVVTKVFVR
jgi:hypothetical protein